MRKDKTMKSVILITSDDKRLYVNQDLVECIQEVDMNSCLLKMASGDAYSIPFGANTVASMLCAKPESEDKLVFYKDWL